MLCDVAVSVSAVSAISIPVLCDVASTCLLYHLAVSIPLLCDVAAYMSLLYYLAVSIPVLCDVAVSVVSLSCLHTRAV